jgi:hypothetical protein
MLQINKYGILLLWVLLAFYSCKKDIGIGDGQSKTFVKFFGGMGADYATDIVSFDNGYALTGTMFTSDSAYQAFLIATDEFGNELSWSPLKFGGISNDIGNKIIRLQSGDFIVVGTEVLSNTAVDSSDIIVAKIGRDGVLKWKKRYAEPSKDEGCFGIETSANELIIGGYTKNLNNGSKDVCLFKLDADGNEVWYSTFGKSKDDWGADIIEMNNSYYMVGSTYSYSLTNNREIFIVKIDGGTGKPIYPVSFGVDNADISGVKLLSLNNSDLLILGQYHQQSTNMYGTYIMRLNEDLNETVWTKLVTSTTKEVASSVMLRTGDLVVMGSKIGSSSGVYSWSFNTNGDLLDSLYIGNACNFTGNAAIITTDGKICVAGSNQIQNKSQIALIKGLF